MVVVVVVVVEGAWRGDCGGATVVVVMAGVQVLAMMMAVNSSSPLRRQADTPSTPRHASIVTPACTPLKLLTPKSSI